MYRPFSLDFNFDQYIQDQNQENGTNYEKEDFSRLRTALFLPSINTAKLFIDHYPKKSNVNVSMCIYNNIDNFETLLSKMFTELIFPMVTSLTCTYSIPTNIYYFLLTKIPAENSTIPSTITFKIPWFRSFEAPDFDYNLLYKKTRNIFAHLTQNNPSPKSDDILLFSPKIYDEKLDKNGFLILEETFLTYGSGFEKRCEESFKKFKHDLYSNKFPHLRDSPRNAFNFIESIFCYCIHYTISHKSLLRFNTELSLPNDYKRVNQCLTRFANIFFSRETHLMFFDIILYGMLSHQFHICSKREFNFDYKYYLRPKYQKRKDITRAFQQPKRRKQQNRCYEYPVGSFKNVDKDGFTDMLFPAINLQFDYTLIDSIITARLMIYRIIPTYTNFNKIYFLNHYYDSEMSVKNYDLDFYEELKKYKFNFKIDLPTYAIAFIILISVDQYLVYAKKAAASIWEVFPESKISETPMYQYLQKLIGINTDIILNKKNQTKTDDIDFLNDLCNNH